MNFHTVLNILLVLNLVGVTATSLILEKDVTQRQFDIPLLRDMADTPAYKAFSTNPHFNDGKTNQRPAEGTIARGFLPFEYGTSHDEAVRAGEELTNKIESPTIADLNRGMVVYQNFCMPCHGDTGKGDGLVTKKGYPPPPSLFLPNAMDMKDGQMYHLITRGQGNMPAYDVQVSREDRWKVIHYIRSIQSEER